MASALPTLSPAVEAPEEEYEISPELEATLPFMKPAPSSSSSPAPLNKAPSSPSVKSQHLRTPLDVRKSAPVTIRIANGASPQIGGSRSSTRPSSRRFSGDIELERLSANNVLEIFDSGSRRPSALDILSHTGSEGAAGKKERRCSSPFPAQLNRFRNFVFGAIIATFRWSVFPMVFLLLSRL